MTTYYKFKNKFKIKLKIILKSFNPFPYLNILKIKIFIPTKKNFIHFIFKNLNFKTLKKL